jgi:predicted restriction endonuclease
MLFDSSRESLRQQWLDAWQRAQAGVVLTPLEATLAELIDDHPEYHAWLRQGDRALHADFRVEGADSNPFLHLSLHLGIREQVATDRPVGIAMLHRQLTQRHGQHEAEHRMLEVLAQTLWEAQRAQRAPDEGTYLERLRSL